MYAFNIFDLPRGDMLCSLYIGKMEFQLFSLALPVLTINIDIYSHQLSFIYALMIDEFIEQEGIVKATIRDGFIMLCNK